MRVRACFVAAVLLLAAPAAAAPPIVRVSSPMLQMARPGAWIPVYVDIEASDAVEGSIQVRFAGGDDNAPAVRAFDVARGGKRRIVVPKRVPAWGYNLEVEVRDGRDRRLEEESIEVRAGAMSPEALRVLVVGDDPLGWPTLQTVTPAPVVGHPEPAQADFRPVLVQNLLPADLPTHWFGWSSVDVLVWPQPDPAALTPEQQAALSGWIAAGGTAVVALGDGHARWTASPLADLAPVRALGVIGSDSARDVLRTLAGSRGALPDSEPVPIVDIAPFPPVEVRLTDDAGKPLVLRSSVGAGQLVLLGFDPGAAELSGRVDRELLWRNLLGLWAPLESAGAPDLDFEDAPAPIDDRGPGLIAPPTPAMARCVTQRHTVGIAGPSLTAWTEAGPWFGAVRDSLVSFEAAAPLGLGFIAVFGLLYLFAIGPLDYFVLRRIGRPMATWVTFPALAIGFSVAAGAVVRQSKGSDSELRCLEVHDVLSEAGVARRTSWCSLWTGRRADVQLRPSDGVGFVVPAAASDYDDGWYGSAGEAVNGDDLVARQVPGRVGLDFSASQWAASTLRGAWEAPTQDRASWHTTQEGRAVQSHLGFDLEGAIVVDGDRFWAVGDLPAGAARPAIERPERPPFDVAELETAWALLADPVEDFGGHLHAGAPGRPLLLGFRRGEPGIALSGLRAEASSTALVRVPLSAEPESAP